MAAPAAQHSDPPAWDGLVRRSLDVDVRSVDEERRSVEVVASTAALDSHNTYVEQDFQLDRYRRNPVVLWAHNNFGGFFGGVRAEDLLPIGRAEETRIEEGALQARIVFASAEANPMAERVYRLVRERVLRGISIGFRPGHVVEEKAPEAADGSGGKTRYRLTQNELFELSVVPVPSNPDAVARAAGIETERLAELAGHAVARGAVAYEAAPPKDGGAWDGSAATARLRKWAAKPDGSTDWAKYRRGFAWYDAGAAETFGAYKLPHHDVRGGALVTVRGGVIAAGNAMSGSRGGVQIPAGDRAAVRGHLAKHYAQFDMEAPWNKGAEDTMDQPTDDGNTTALRADECPGAHCPSCEQEKAAAKAAAMKASEATARAETAEKRLAALDAATVERDVDDAIREQRVMPAERAEFVELRKSSPDLYRRIVAKRTPVGLDRAAVPPEPRAGESTVDTGGAGKRLADEARDKAYAEVQQLLGPGAS